MLFVLFLAGFRIILSFWGFYCKIVGLTQHGNPGSDLCIMCKLFRDVVVGDDDSEASCGDDA